MSAKPHIAVLMGGWSPEREISLISGAGCANALRELGYTVSEVDVGRDLFDRLRATKPDICFNALHGAGGEDGVVQGVLEMLQIPYTHSGVRASALAMDKDLSKKLFAAAGLPVAPWLLVGIEGCTEHPMPPPYVVKPVNQGSSVGVLLVRAGQDMPDVLHKGGWLFDSPAMVEAYIAGRELTCAVLNGTPTQIMEVQPAASNDFYDYRAKYDDDGSHHHVPADINDDIKLEIQTIAARAHTLLGCRGATRADFRYDENGAGVVLLELNTQPGMTPMSLVPEMVAEQGMSYAQLVEWMVEDASCLR